MLVNGLGKAGAFAAPGYSAEYLLLQVWASLYRFVNDWEIMEIRSYKKLHAEIFYCARFCAFRCASFLHKNALRKIFR